MPAAKGRLTDREREFARVMALTGDKALAAAKAGYSSPRQAAHYNSQNPDVQNEIRRVARHTLQTKGAETGVRVLIEIAEDAKQPGGTRVRAATELVKHSGVGAAEDLTDKDLADMSPAEVQTLLDKARRELALRLEGAKVIDAKPIEEEPETAGIFD